LVERKARIQCFLFPIRPLDESLFASSAGNNFLLLGISLHSILGDHHNKAFLLSIMLVSPELNLFDFVQSNPTNRSASLLVSCHPLQIIRSCIVIVIIIIIIIILRVVISTELSVDFFSSCIILVFVYSWMPVWCCGVLLHSGHR
jgi:uncharacterized protein (DUF486 family)